jgi:hypothetical protein
VSGREGVREARAAHEAGKTRQRLGCEVTMARALDRLFTIEDWLEFEGEPTSATSWSTAGSWR